MGTYEVLILLFAIAALGLLLSIAVNIARCAARLDRIPLGVLLAAVNAARCARYLKRSADQ